MRRPIRPFTIERKRSGRAGQMPEAPLLEAPPPPPEFTAPKPAQPPRWAAAEALFSTPKEQTDEGSAQFAAAAPAGRILPSLIEPPPVAPVLTFEEDAPKRRGRKPGSRNKSPRAAHSEQGPKTIESVMRNLFEFWAREDEQRSEPQPEPAPASASAPEGSGLTRLALRRRGRAAREDFPRGQRWKARLPHSAR